MHNVINKYSDRTTIKRRKTAVCSRHRTVASLYFVSTALLRYGARPYSTVFCTAVAVYGTVVSLTGSSPSSRVVEVIDALALPIPRACDLPD